MRQLARNHGPLGIWPERRAQAGQGRGHPRPPSPGAGHRRWLRHLALAALLPLAGAGLDAGLDVALAQPAPPPAAQVQPAPPSEPGGASPPVQPVPIPPAAPARPPVETPAIILDGSVADTLLGKPVRGANGDDMGRITDVMVDRAGTIRAAIIDFGGFLGVGTRKIAVDWRVLHFASSGAMDAIGADLSRDQLRTAPVYKPGEPVVIIGRADPAAPAAANPPAAASAAAAAPPVLPAAPPATPSAPAASASPAPPAPDPAVKP